MKNLFRVPFAMLLACMIFVSCSKEEANPEILQKDFVEKNMTFSKESLNELTSEDIELGRGLVEIATKMEFEQEYLTKENIDLFFEDIEDASSDEGSMSFEKYSFILNENLSFNVDANIEFLSFVLENKEQLSMYSPKDLANIMHIVIEEDYPNESERIISTVAGWFGIGGADSSCSEQVLVAFADTAISGIAFVGSTATGPGAVIGALNLAASYGNLIYTATTCE